MLEFIVLLAGAIPAIGGVFSPVSTDQPSEIFCSSKKIRYYDQSFKVISVAPISEEAWKEHCSRLSFSRSDGAPAHLRTVRNVPRAPKARIAATVDVTSPLE